MSRNISIRQAQSLVFDITRETVENPLWTLMQEVYGDDQLREQEQLQGTMVFKSRTNLP
jgi:hypothetical protein